MTLYGFHGTKTISKIPATPWIYRDTITFKDEYSLLKEFVLMKEHKTIASSMQGLINMPNHERDLPSFFFDLV